MIFFKRNFLKIIIALIVLSIAYILWARPRQLKVWVNRKQAEFASFDFGKSSPTKPIKSKTSSKDGMIQVYVPAGEFMMGSDDKDDPKSNPQHAIFLNAYWIDLTEVSNAMFAKCVNDGACPTPANDQFNPNYNDPAYANYPIVNIPWGYTVAYCEWAGRRLPTEAEWEKAARGTDGRLYPWGNTPPDLSLANFNNNIGGLVPVDRYPLGASPYGALNMAGNAREWTWDWFDKMYYRESPGFDPQGPATGYDKTLRGGSYDDDARQLRVFNRFDHNPKSPGENRGFRCAESAE